MANNKKNNQNKNLIRIIVLVIVTLIALIVSVGMNISGMRAAINKESDTSGMAGFSVRVKKSESLGNVKETKVSDDGTIAEENILINALPIVKLNNYNWNRVKANFGGFQLDEDGTAIFEDGYKLYCNGTYVNYIVFDNTYEKEIVGHIKVGTDFKEIEKNLGTPTFKTKKYLGYKTKEVYVFFYEDEAVVYSNKSQTNTDIETLFKSYLEKTYEKGRTYFLVEIRNNYPDFQIELDENNNLAIITSLERKVVAKLDSIGNIEVEFYNGYNFALNETKEYIEAKRYEINEDDLVEIIENERVSGK